MFTTFFLSIACVNSTDNKATDNQISQNSQTATATETAQETDTTTEEATETSTDTSTETSEVGDFDLAALEVGIHESQTRYLAEDNSNQAEIFSMPQDLPPEYGEQFELSSFGTNITKLSSLAISNHIYSQLQAFSADNRFVLLLEGDSEYDMTYVIKEISSRQSYLDLGLLDSYQCPRWHPTTPDTLLHFNSSQEARITMQSTNVLTSQTTDIFLFPQDYDDILTNQSLDEASRDGRWIAGMLAQNDGNGLIYALDMEQAQLGAQLDLFELYNGPCVPSPDYGIIDPDWVGVSPLGNYLMVQWARSGTDRCSGLESFDIQTGEYLGHVTAEHPHGDLQVLADGTTEVFVSVEYQGPSATQSYVNGTPGGDWLESSYPALSYRILPGTPQGEAAPNYLYLTDWIFEHMSCRGPNGYCLVSAYENPMNGFADPLEAELFLLRTDGGGLIRLGHHRSSGESYWSQPRATFSKDGRFVLFDSDWGRSNGETDAYLMDLALP